ncbi:MAG: putative DNA-binding protein, histone-like [bacterium P3]|nr:MAG: putative DNA-binding protein, histone-like [bacterium P3]KWW42131.1 MAG: putative DNA-binding protein, histone-like [bacterium F083]
MALFYNIVPKSDPLNPQNDVRKYYAVLRSLGMIDEREVAKIVSNETGLSLSEAETAILSLEKAIVRHLLEGYTVKLGGMGSFSLTINSTGSFEAEEVSPDNIKKVNLNFRPSATLKQALHKAKFHPVG